jgi:hypothetical protein
MVYRCALALIAATLVVTPALAIDTQPATALGPQIAGTLRPPADVPNATGAKADAATVEKPSQHVTAQQAMKKAKHAKPASKSKVAKSSSSNSKLGASNHRNSNHANSKQKKLSKAQSRPVENGTPANVTGSIPPRSLLPALY